MDPVQKGNLWDLKIHQLDVGQGDSAIVTFSYKQKIKMLILIDGGEGWNSSLIDQYLSGLGSKRFIDVVIITHFDQDHWEGVKRLLDETIWIKKNHTVFFVQAQDQIPVPKKKAKGKRKSKARAFANELTKSTSGFQVFSDQGKVLGKSIWELVPPLDPRLLKDAPDLKFLAMNGFVLQMIEDKEKPSENAILSTDTKSNGTHTNQGSISCLIKFGDFCHLTSGDLCKPQEEALKNYLTATSIKITGTKISHHGSLTSSEDEFLQSLKCRYAIISHGQHGRHDHPRREILNSIFHNPIQKCYLTNQYKIGEFLEDFVFTRNKEFFEKIQFGERMRSFKNKNKEFIDLLSKIDNFISELSKEFNIKINFPHQSENFKFRESLSCLITQLEAFTSMSPKIKKLGILKDFPSEAVFQTHFEKFNAFHSDLNDFDKQFFEIACSSSNLTPFPTDLKVFKKTLKKNPKIQENANGKVDKVLQEKEQKLLDQLKNILNEERIEIMLKNLMQDSNSLIHGLKSFGDTWNKFQNKMYVAGNPNILTRSGVTKRSHGHISIEVKPLKNMSLQTKIEYEMIEKNQIRKIEDFYLLKSKAKIETLFKKYLPKDGQTDIFIDILKDKRIEKLKNLFRSERMQQNFEDERCQVIFKKKKIGKDSEEISFKLKSGSVFISKIKYFYDVSENPEDKKWAILREVNPKENPMELMKEEKEKLKKEQLKKEQLEKERLKKEKEKLKKKTTQEKTTK